MSYLPVSDSEFRFALPVSSWAPSEQDPDKYEARDALELLEVTVTDGVFRH